MKTIVVLATVLAVALAAPADTYDTKYDDFDVTSVVSSVRLMKNYMNCFLEKGPCTSEGADFRRKIREALQTDCAKCTPKQRQLIRTMSKGFQTKLPEQWEELLQKVDPKGEFKESFEKFLQATN